MAALTGKERLEAFQRAVGGLATPAFRLDVSRGLADSARSFIFSDLAKKFVKRSGRLTGATAVDEVSQSGFRMKAATRYAGTLNWGSNRIVRKRYAVHVAPGLIRFVPTADAAHPGVFLLTMRQKYRKRQFIPARVIPVRWLKAFQPIVEGRIRTRVKMGVA